VKRPKHGFNVPLDHWFRGAWRGLLEEAFAEGSALRRLGFVDGKGRNAALALSDDVGRVSGHTLLSMVVLNLWLEQVHHGNHR